MKCIKLHDNIKMKPLRADSNKGYTTFLLHCRKEKQFSGNFAWCGRFYFILTLSEIKK